jgi:transposase InsO family protein
MVCSTSAVAGIIRGNARTTSAGIGRAIGVFRRMGVLKYHFNYTSCEHIVHTRSCVHRLVLEQKSVDDVRVVCVDDVIRHDRVRKWRQRLSEVTSEDEEVLHCRSHRPKHMPRQVTPEMEERIVVLREALSVQLNRKAGPRTIAAWLHKEAQRWEGVILPSSTTIWRILRRRQYIFTPVVQPRHPFERPAPGIHWEIDFCTASRQSPEAPDKQQNALEILNVIDRGSSAHIDSQPSTQFDAETALLSIATTLHKQGIPRCITYDRDPRFIGSQSTDGFPSAFTRFLLCLGCAVDILPPRRPDLKPFVERFQRTLKEECLKKYHPETTDSAKDALRQYCHWYNHERPHQARDFADEPPVLRLPPSLRLPRLPEQVDPDAWLVHYDQHSWRRHVDRRGTIQLWKYAYYVGQFYANQTVRVRLDAHSRLLSVEISRSAVKIIPLKGLYGQMLDFQSFLGFMCDEARSEWKHHLWRQRLKTNPSSL